MDFFYSLLHNSVTNRREINERNTKLSETRLSHFQANEGRI